MLDDDFDSENNNPWYCPICCDTIYWDEAKEEIKEYIRNHSDVIDGDAMIPIQSHTLAAKCRSGTKGYYKRKRANGNYYFQVQVKLTHNKKENYIFSRNYDFEHHAKIAFALVTHKEYDLFHDEYLRMVTHVDTIGKVTIDELRQIMKHRVVNEVVGYERTTSSDPNGRQLIIRPLGHEFSLGFWEGDGYELARKKGNEIFREYMAIIDTDDNNNNNNNNNRPIQHRNSSSKGNTDKTQMLTDAEVSKIAVDRFQNVAQLYETTGQSLLDNELIQPLLDNELIDALLEKCREFVNQYAQTTALLRSSSEELTVFTFLLNRYFEESTYRISIGNEIGEPENMVLCTLGCIRYGAGMIFDWDQTVINNAFNRCKQYTGLENCEQICWVSNNKMSKGGGAPENTPSFVGRLSFPLDHGLSTDTTKNIRNIIPYDDIIRKKIVFGPSKKLLCIFSEKFGPCGDFHNRGPLDGDSSRFFQMRDDDSGDLVDVVFIILHGCINNPITKEAIKAFHNKAIKENVTLYYAAIFDHDMMGFRMWTHLVELLRYTIQLLPFDRATPKFMLDKERTHKDLNVLTSEVHLVKHVSTLFFPIDYHHDTLQIFPVSKHINNYRWGDVIYNEINFKLESKPCDKDMPSSLRGNGPRIVYRTTQVANQNNNNNNEVAVTSFQDNETNNNDSDKSIAVEEKNEHAAICNTTNARGKCISANALGKCIRSHGGIYVSGLIDTSVDKAICHTDSICDNVNDDDDDHDKIDNINDDVDNICDDNDSALFDNIDESTSVVVQDKVQEQSNSLVDDDDEKIEKENKLEHGNYNEMVLRLNQEKLVRNTITTTCKNNSEAIVIPEQKETDTANDDDNGTLLDSCNMINKLEASTSAFAVYKMIDKFESSSSPDSICGVLDIIDEVDNKNDDEDDCLLGALKRLNLESTPSLSANSIATFSLPSLSPSASTVIAQIPIHIFESNGNGGNNDDRNNQSAELMVRELDEMVDTSNDSLPRTLFDRNRNQQIQHFDEEQQQQQQQQQQLQLMLDSNQRRTELEMQLQQITSTIQQLVAVDTAVGGSSSRMDNDDEEDVILPSPFDIIMGSGNHNKNKPGNARLRTLLESYSDRYNSTRSTNEKTALIQTILKHVDESGSRFLIQDKDTHGMWTIAARAKAHDKIANDFRNMRRNKQTTSTIQHLVAVEEQEPPLEFSGLRLR